MMTRMERFFLPAYLTCAVIVFTTVAYFMAADEGIVPAPGTPEPIAVKIASSLRDHPEEWSGDEIIIHNKISCLWVGNKVYGLGIGDSYCGPNRGALSLASRSFIYRTAETTVIPRLRAARIAELEAKLQ